MVVVVCFYRVIFSQILIITSWQDAKFGMIPNIIILLVVIISFSIWQFQVQVEKELLLITPIKH
jgi:Flp pilus assembly protein protease CpaA